MSGILLSLKDGCLNTIVQNIEVFAHAYDVTESPYLKRLFLGLQRRYTMEILSRAGREQMKDEYLSLLLNESLSSINLELFDFCSPQKLSNRICQVGHSVRELIVSQTCWWGFSLDKWEAVLKSLKNLQVLHFYMMIPALFYDKSTSSDQLLKTIVRNCPLLKDLKVSRSPITDTGLDYICGFDNKKSDLQCLSLQKLDVTFTHVTHSGLAFVLQNIDTLHELKCYSLPDALMTVYENYSVIQEKKHLNLTNLDFETYQLKNRAYSTEEYISVCIKLCPKTKFLRIRHLSNESELLVCSRFENLNSVILSLKPDTVKVNADNFLISQGSRLSNLILSNFEISLSAIDHCYNLQKLQLHMIKVMDTDTIAAHPFRCLNVLVLRFSNSENVNKKFVTSILKLATNLKILELYRCSIDEKLGIEIMKYTSLTRIEFVYSDVTFDLLRKILLKCCHSLKKVDISSGNLSDDDWEILKTICSNNEREIQINRRIDYDLEFRAPYFYGPSHDTPCVWGYD